MTARNVLVAELRREAVNQQMLAPALLGQFQQPEEPPAPDQGLLLEVLACVRQLPEQQQRIILADLRLGGPTPAAELAAGLGTKPATIYAARSKALKKLRQLLADQGRTFQ